MVHTAASAMSASARAAGERDAPGTEQEHELSCDGVGDGPGAHRLQA